MTGRLHPEPRFWLWLWLSWLLCGLSSWPAPSLAETRADPLVTVADGRRLAPDIARIVKRGLLIVAMADFDTPPFFYRRDGRLQGLDVEMAHDLARALGVTASFDREAESFNEVVERVAEGRADLGLSKLSRTLARAQQVRFSTPYLRLHHALALNRLEAARLAKNRPIQSLVRDFTGSLGVIANSAFSDFARQQFPRASVRVYPDWSAVIEAVRAGEIVAAYRDEFEIKRLLNSDPQAALELRTVTLTDLEDTLSIAVGINDRVLLDVVNLFLEQRPDKLDIDAVLRAVSR